jgi:stearoyl-CoA desaturase (delta-9 desaturase)
MSASAPAVSPGADDVQPVANEALDRFATGTITILPFIGLGIAIWQAWGGWLHVSDLIVFLLMYIPTGLGITVGFHRLFTHRSFKARKPVRGALAILGSAAIEGPITAWVADHRKHHAFADQHGDPHSPHVDHGHGWSGALKGLLHAHVGWLFLHDQRGNKARYAPDLQADPMIRWIDKMFLVWALGGLILPFFLGWAIGGTVVAGLTGMLWGGLIRMLVLHHVTYSINSLCHFFGRRRFATDDHSTNFAPLALLSFGESWHNNHHAFPTSARHGLRRWEIDLSAAVIWGLEKTGLAWDVVRISRERQAEREGPRVAA